MTLSTPRQSVHDEVGGLSALKITMASALCIVLSAAAPHLWGDEAQNRKASGNASAFLVIGPETRDRMAPGMLARARALRTEWKQKELAARKIADGPCMCGAPSHGACKTKKVCEPIEKARIDRLVAQSVAARDALRALLPHLKDLKAGKDAGGVLAAARADVLHIEISLMDDLRTRLKHELENVRNRSPYNLKLRLCSMDALSVAKQVTDDLIDLLPEDQQGTFKAISDTLMAAVEAAASEKGSAERKAKTLEAMAHASVLIREGLRHLPGVTDASKALLKGINDSYKLVISISAAYEEWNRTHDVDKVKARMGGLAVQTADLFKDWGSPTVKLGAKVFKTSYQVTSYGVLGWHITDVARVMKLDLDMNRDAQVSLLRKIHRLNSHIAYKKRELKRYEQRSTAN